MREIKFRAWHDQTKKMYTLITLQWLEALYIGGIGAFNEVMYEVDETVHLMQYTGLTDKNGTEIYEGDVVRGYGVTTRVRYNNIGYSPFTVSVEKYERFRASNCEVIGNIYENPELLTV